MPVKIAELRNRGDEVAREEMMRMVRGAPPTPKLQQNFGELMKLVCFGHVNHFIVTFCSLR